jgi:fructose-1,6-bisphosphatase/inositol monophosphatase family enzyme
VGEGWVLEVLDEAARSVRHALDGLDDWGLADTRPGQYHSDLVADLAAVEVLVGHGLGVLSEESGLHYPDRDVLVVLDPVDGSTNASRRIPWWATSLCAMDGAGPLAALVVNQATGTRWEAVRGSGARRDGEAVRPSRCSNLAEAFVGISGLPGGHVGWRQFRALGAAALDLCAVAGGTLDAFIDWGTDAHGPWDYLGGLLVCWEAGAVVADVGDRELVARTPLSRRTVLAAATPQLLAEARTARSTA